MSNKVRRHVVPEHAENTSLYARPRHPWLRTVLEGPVRLLIYGSVSLRLKTIEAGMPLGLLLGVLLLAPTVSAAEVPEGLGEGKHFESRPEPMRLDALFGEGASGPDDKRDVDDQAESGDTETAQGGTEASEAEVPVAPSVLQQSSAEAGDCPTERARTLRKRVAITAFPVLNEREAVLGGLNDASRELPGRLLQAFQSEGRLRPHSAIDSRLYGKPVTAPTQRQGERRLSKASRLSRSMGAQFVVSGVIRDMRVLDSDAWGTSIVSRLSRTVGFAEQSRRLVVDLYVHDGFSGALLMEKRFAASGEWPYAPGRRIGFGSAEFNTSHYGREAGDMVARMVATVSQVLECQPFMAPIERVDKRRIRIASGTESGIEPGDEVALYRSERFLDLTDDQPLLQPMEQTMRVERVQAGFSSGRLALEGQRINVQRGDMVVIW